MSNSAIGTPSKCSDAELQALFDAGLSDEAIADRVGITPKRVQSRRLQLGLLRQGSTKPALTHHAKTDGARNPRNSAPAVVAARNARDAALYAARDRYRLAEPPLWERLDA
jgi:hypothetical protein